MKTVLVMVALLVVASSAFGESYRERRLRKNLTRMMENGTIERNKPIERESTNPYRRWRMRQRKTIIHTEVDKKGDTVTEYDYGINQYRMYEINEETNTDPIPSPLSPTMKGWPNIE